jgi:hypothetical protein
MNNINLEIKQLIEEIKQEQKTWDSVGPYKNSFYLFERCIEQLKKLSGNDEGLPSVNQPDYK